MRKKILSIAILGIIFGVNAQEIIDNSLLIRSNNDAIITFQTLDDTWLYTQWKNKSGVRKAYMGFNPNLTSFILGLENGANKFVIPNGNVGIGTKKPENLLHIKHSQNTNYALKIQSNTWQDNTKSLIKFANSGSENIHSAYIGTIRIPSGFGKADIIFGTNSGNVTIDNISERMRITYDGNVGIGTTNPKSKLTVAGNIHSREVKVTIDAGADFVFENNYNLPSLEFIEKFIKKNKHLPEIASEKEMKKNGLFLAEMNIKLLQKIEELTLYTIAQEKNINEHKLKFENIDTENKILKSVLERLTKIEDQLKNKN